MVDRLLSLQNTQMADSPHNHALRSGPPSMLSAYLFEWRTHRDSNTGFQLRRLE